MILYADPWGVTHDDQWDDSGAGMPCMLRTQANHGAHDREFASIGRAYQAAAMTEHYYLVFQVPDSGIDPEDEPERLGSKRKFWFRREGRRPVPVQVSPARFW